jgi:hypothetical protein
MSVYQLHPNINELHPILNEKKGKWIHLNCIPTFPHERYLRNKNLFNEKENNCEKEIKYYLSSGFLHNEPISNDIFPKKVSFESPQETGLTSGNWLGCGFSTSADHPTDQREDDGRSLSFDSLSLTNQCGKQILFLFFPL